MQVFVKLLSGKTVTVEVEFESSAEELHDNLDDKLCLLQEHSGGPRSFSHTYLTHNSRRIQRSKSTPLSACGIQAGATVHQSGRLLGGKSVKVMLLANPGGSVSIDISEDTSKSELKRKLEEATGVPAKYQKIVLAGINQLYMGDKRRRETTKHVEAAIITAT